MAFFGFLRVGEFTCPGSFDPSQHLSGADVRLDSPGSFRLFIKSSKTDPFYQGCFVYLGQSGHPICPVLALHAFHFHRGNSPGPLFAFQNGRPLSPAQLNLWLRSILAAAGIQGNYSSNIFRIGATTSAAIAGMPDHLIKALGRWSCDAYLRYIRTPPHVLLSASRFLV